MSAYMVHNDTLDLLASINKWSIRSQGLRLTVANSVEMPELPSDAQVHKYDDLTIIALTSSAESTTWVKQVLHDANVASLVARYGDDPNDYAMIPYRYISMDASEEGYKAVFGAIRCFEYQSCEVRNWEHTFAYRLLHAMQDKMLSMFTEGHWEYWRPVMKPIVQVVQVPEVTVSNNDGIWVELDNSILEDVKPVKRPRGRPRKNK